MMLFSSVSPFPPQVCFLALCKAMASQLARFLPLSVHLAFPRSLRVCCYTFPEEADGVKCKIYADATQVQELS